MYDGSIRTHVRSDNLEGQSVGTILLPSQVGRVVLERRQQKFRSIAVYSLDCSPMVDVLQLEEYARSADQILSTQRMKRL